jgi:hypothetical protein
MKFWLDHKLAISLTVIALVVLGAMIYFGGRLVSSSTETPVSDNPAFAKATAMVKDAQTFAATATANEDGRVALQKAAEEAAILKGLPTATETPQPTSTPASTATPAATIDIPATISAALTQAAPAPTATPTAQPTQDLLSLFTEWQKTQVAALPPTMTPAPPTMTPAAQPAQPAAAPAAPAQPAAPVISSGSGIFTEIHPLQDGQCQPLSSGQPMVWKDYVRSQKLVRIYAHDGKGELGSEICRGVTDWGWRVPWDGMESFDGAKKYAMEEAWRVLASIDPNPAFPQGDPIVRIEVYYLDQLIWVKDLTIPTATPAP